MDSSKRFITAVLAAGLVVLLVAIVVGERMGDQVMVQAVDEGNTAQTPLITPLPESTATGSYGPDWKSNQALAAAPDPRFPDPRVPPKPLPTIPPTPKPTPTPKWTPNPSLPIWDQTTLPSASPSPPDSTTDESVPPTPEPTPTP